MIHNIQEHERSARPSEYSRLNYTTKPFNQLWQQCDHNLLP